MNISFIYFLFFWLLFSNAQSNIARYKNPEAGVDYPGNDIKINGQVGINVATSALCAAECDKIGPLCQGFVYWKSTFVGNIYGQNGVVVQGGSCFPKNCFPQAVAIPDADLYVYKSEVYYSSASRVTANGLLSGMYKNVIYLMSMFVK